MISKENAYRSVLAFVGSDIGRDLNDEQAEELTKRLMMRVKNDIVMEPAAVEPHVAALFPPEADEDYLRRTQHGRVVPPREKQPKQTHEQAVAVITDFLNKSWHLVAPGCLLPTVSRINHAAFFDAVNAWAKQGGLIRADYLADIAARLFQRGALEKIPAPVEVVPPPPPPSPQEQARELAKKQYDFGRKLNDRDTSPIRGAKESAKPLVQPKVVLTEEQRVALNEKKRADDAVIAEAMSRINGYLGYSHSQTASGRAQLREVFQASMDSGKSAKEVLAAVEAKADQLAGNSSIR